MVDQKLPEALNDCINRMAAGQTINDCLPYYPQYAEVLQPLLEVGRLVADTQANSLEVALAKDHVRNRVSARVQNRPARPVRQSYSRFVVLAASLVIVFSAVFGLAENSLPGDSLYAVKRFSENARSALIGQQFSTRRLDEIRTLEVLKRSAEVEFRGQVEQIDGTTWRIDSLNIQVNAGTLGATSVIIGDTVHVSAHTTMQGDLVASELTPLVETVAPPVATVPQSISTTLEPMVAPTCIPTRPDGWRRYTAHSGDTVSELAYLTGASVQKLLEVNCLPQTRMIIVGQTLFLPILPLATPTISPSSPESLPLELQTKPHAENPEQSNLQAEAPTEPSAGQPTQPSVQPSATRSHQEDDGDERDDHHGEDDD